MSIRPSVPIDIKQTENNPSELERIYQLGRSDANNCIQELRMFLQ